MPKIEVYKFGGVAVGSADAIRAAAAHVKRAAPGVAVVVSAMNGVTDMLLAAANAALRRDRDACERAALEFEKRHTDVIEEILRAPRALLDELAASAHELRSMCESIAVLRELTPRAQDALVARGEQLNARIFVALLNEQSIDAAYVDAVDIITTERRLGSLWPHLEECERAAKKRIAPLVAKGVVVVMPGFIGSGPDGELVTLGRGGTDFSAAILARSIGARAVTLWKEVDGLMTADPRSVPAARVIAELHYREAAELAFYGAKVLHPRTMIPLVDRGIPLYVRNTFSHDKGAGTRIAGDVKPGSYPVKALTAIHKQSLVAIEGRGMIGVPGVAGRAFTALSRAGHSVSFISQASSEASICFVVPQSESDHAVRALDEEFAYEQTLKLIDRVRATKDIALVAVVGLGMQGRPGIAARTFGALSHEGVNVVAIAQGSSELNITVAIDEAEAGRALNALHREFQLDRIRPLADTNSRESKLTILGFGQIGRELARQLGAQDKQLRSQLGADIRIIAVADRSGVKVQERGFGATALERLASRKKSGARLFDRDAVGMETLREMLREELWLLPSRRPILVDLTSDETAPLIEEALQRGFHVVLANKKPLAIRQDAYDRMFQVAREQNVALRYEATAGAGLPVLDTLQKLQDSGDRVSQILGCFSGTLGFIMTALEDGASFSDAVRNAWKLGYTEPDPRDDLSGMDVARKALILARTLGRRAEMDEIDLEPLFPAELGDDDPATFIANLATLDDAFAKRVAQARREKKVLRYAAKIARGGIRVGIEAVAEASPMGRLRGTDNQVAIHSKRYKTNPLVVTGPGAGAAVTAAGVLNDIVAITLMEQRRR